MRLSDSARDRQKAGFKHPKAMDQVRELWQDVGNEHLARAGHEARIDHRTLKAQQIDREPTIHVGPNAQARQQKGQLPESQDRELAAAFNSGDKVPAPYQLEKSKRQVNYANEIDQGRTREERNAEIARDNAHRERIAHEQLRLLDQAYADAIARDDHREERAPLRDRAPETQMEAPALEPTPPAPAWAGPEPLRALERAGHRQQARHEQAKVPEREQRWAASPPFPTMRREFQRDHVQPDPAPRPRRTRTANAGCGASEASASPKNSTGPAKAPAESGRRSAGSVA